MIVEKSTVVECENTPAAIALAMIEAEVPGHARIVDTLYKQKFTDFRSGPKWRGPFGSTAIEIEMVYFTFNWTTEEGRQKEIVVPDYRRIGIL